MKNASLQNVHQKSIDVMHGFCDEHKSLKKQSVDRLCNAVPPLMQGIQSEFVSAKLYVGRTFPSASDPTK